MSVGNKELDADHKVLMGLINKCQTYLDNGGDYKVLHELLTELYEYTSYHFKREESLMENSGYPELESHKQLHEEMTIKVEVFLSELARKGDLTTAEELLEFLINWWRTHIREKDRDYQPWVEKLKGQLEE